MDPYTTIQGDMIDAICRKVYGDESEYVEAVLEFNQGLSAYDAILPIGVVIYFPEIEKSDDIELVRLWD